MKGFLTVLILSFIAFNGYSQKAYHVFPIDHIKTPGSKYGDGSLKRPWDLQTALSQKSEKINGGDTIWLHGGIYTGRFKSKLNSTISGKNVIVSSYKNEWAILNGNINSEASPVLTVNGQSVTYQNFEVSPLNLKSRVKGELEFKQFSGISHTSGKNCKFINLVIHGNNGLGFGSWNKTGGTIITNCIIYNNGYVNFDGKGFGEGMYVQNDSEIEMRVIKNNIIFNNYYKGIEIWSASRNANREWVKNISCLNNVIFNSGLLSGKTVDNIIVATDDRNGVNIAKNIKILDNILYHNTDFKINEVNGDAPSLTLGYYHKSPVENIVVKNNLILGRNNPLRLLYAKTVSITNNIFYGGYLHLMSSTADNIKANSLNHNVYYTKNNTPFRVDKQKHKFTNWQQDYNQDIGSEHKNIKYFDLPEVLDISKNSYKENSFRVVLFSKNENDILVDFNKFDIPSKSNYIIRDVENLDKELKKGAIGSDTKILFPMNVERTVHKTLNNFGVYIIDFEKQVVTDEKEGFFKRLFSWLF